VWHAQTGRLLSSWFEPSEHSLIGFDSKNRLIFLDKGIQMISDPLTGKTIEVSKRIYAEESMNVHKIISRDGRVAVTWEFVQSVENATNRPAGCKIKVWSIPGGNIIKSFDMNTSEDTKFILSPTGEFICCLQKSDAEVLIYIFRLNEGPEEPKKVKTKYNIDISCAALSHDGKLIAFGLISSSNKNADFVVFQIEDFSVVKILEDESASHHPECFFDLTGKYFTTRNDLYGYASIWKTDGWKKYLDSEIGYDARISLRSNYVVSTPANPGGMWVRYTGYHLRVHDMNSGHVDVIHDESHWIEDMAISSNGRYLSVIEKSGNWIDDPNTNVTLKFFDLTQGKLIWKLNGIYPSSDSRGRIKTETDSWFNRCVLSADGKILASRTEAGQVFVWKMPEGRLIRKIEGYGGEHSGVALSSDGQLIAADHLDCITQSDTNGDYIGRPNCIKVYNVNEGHLVERFDRYHSDFDHIYELCFSYDNRLLAIGSTNWSSANLNQSFGVKTEYRNEVNIRNITTNETASIISGIGRDDKVYPIGFNSNSEYILIGKRVYRISNGELIHTITGAEDLANMALGNFWVHSWGMAFNIGSPHFVMTSKERDGIEIRDLRTGKLKGTLYSMQDGSVLLTPEGLFSGSGDLRQYVHFVKGTKVYQHKNLYEKFSRPELLK